MKTISLPCSLANHVFCTLEGCGCRCHEAQEDLRKKIADRVSLLYVELNSWLPPSVREAYEKEIYELLPLGKLDPGERGISMHRWRMWQIREQCEAYLKKKAAQADPEGRGRKESAGGEPT